MRNFLKRSPLQNLISPFQKAGPKLSNAFRSLALFFLSMYRVFGSPHFGGSCRFEPSCSVYAEQAVKIFGPLISTKLIATRLARCRPFGPYGVDPLPMNIKES